MAEAAPQVPKVPGGLFIWRAASERRLAKALAASVFVHALLLWGNDFPRLGFSARPVGEAGPLAGQLRLALVSVAAKPDMPSSGRVPLAPEKKLPVHKARAPERLAALAAQPHAPSSVGALEPVAAASLSAYRLTVARQARQFRQYPQVAGATGMAGEALITMRSVPGGPQLVVGLQQSSGNSQLDEAALNMITQAVRLVPLPADWYGRTVQIELPVQFAP